MLGDYGALPHRTLKDGDMEIEQLLGGKRKPKLWKFMVIGTVGTAGLVVAARSTPRGPVMGMAEQPIDPVLRQRYSYADLREAMSLCSDFDDDEKYPSHKCDCDDLVEECTGEMMHSPRYHDACFQESCGNAEEGNVTCGGSRSYTHSWANLCSWQMIRDLPGTCNGTFAPELPFYETSRDLPGSEMNPHVQSYKDGMAGTCAFHSFCFTCLDDSPLGVNPFCAAVYFVHGGKPTRSNFFNDVDTDWCPRLDDILAFVDDIVTSSSSSVE